MDPVWSYQPGFETLDEHALFTWWRSFGASQAASYRLAKASRRSYAEIDALRRGKLWTERARLERQTLEKLLREEVQADAEIMRRLRAQAQEGLALSAELANLRLAHEKRLADERSTVPDIRPIEAMRAIQAQAKALADLGTLPEAPEERPALDLGKLSAEEQLALRALLGKAGIRDAED